MLTWERERRERKQKDPCPSRPFTVDVHSVTCDGAHILHACGSTAYVCYQRVQVHAFESVMSHISGYLNALKVWHNISLSVSLLIKRKSKLSQRKHRMRKEAGRQTKKTWKRIGLCAYNHINVREGTQQDRDGKKRIHSMINCPHWTEEKGLWELEEYTKLTHIHIHKAAPFNKVWAAVFQKVH